MSTSTDAVSSATSGEILADQTPKAHLGEVVRAEYREMPGLNVTVRQAARLWGLDVDRSERLLSAMVDDGFLVRDARGAYRRRTSPL
jgi:hypothetical protein